MVMERTLPRAAYVEEGEFERERVGVFLSEWMCVARVEDLPDEGSTLVLDLAGESILLVRGRDGNLRAFHNLCRHRGSSLLPRADGTACGTPDRFRSVIRCPYHSWTYGLDGKLRSAPFLPEDAGLVREDLGLFEVAVSSWGGFVFCSAEPRRTLEDQLGGIPHRLRRYPLRELRRAERIVYDVGANWKVILENYNECYHCGPVHPELCEVVPAFRKGGGDLDWEEGIPHREGAWTFTRTGSSARAPLPGLSEGERSRHKGELAFPNLMLSLSADHVTAFTLWPQGAGRTLVSCDFLFHPDEMARPGFDPTDATGFWDLINRQDWEICGRVQEGMRSRAFDRGIYAPMEDPSADIRRYVAELLEGEERE